MPLKVTFIGQFQVPDFDALFTHLDLTDKPSIRRSISGLPIYLIFIGCNLVRVWNISLAFARLRQYP